MKHVHLIGIGGTGLSAIARVLLERGYAVSGSDREASPLFKAITAAGARTFLGHAAEQIAGADLVIRSSAIPDDNPEVIAAQEMGIPVMKRAEFLEELTADKDTLAIAGSHGKTTTTAMLIWVLEALGEDPSFIVGGVVSQLECNARAGAGLYFAIEADEYDSMFLGLAPKIGVITNLEHDHPDCFPTEEDYLSAFRQFLNRVRPDGLALICHDDPQALQLAAEKGETPFQVMTYGTDPEANYQAAEIDIINGLPSFVIKFKDAACEKKSLVKTQLQIPGKHNVLNATAVLGIIHQLGLPLEKAAQALSEFTGAGRRFEILGEAGGVTVIDDYGHHPTEIGATLEAAQTRYPDRRIWAVWQPHTFSRTRTLESAFIEALNIADRVAVLKIYAAREADPGYSAKKIADELPEEKAVYLDDFTSAKAYLTENLEPGDVAIVFSAGDATEISQDVLARLADPDEDRKEG
ncbi:MAG: UDP-N-acetylmuramate--L-alanine ligase [Brevefilum sp.]